MTLLAGWAVFLMILSIKPALDRRARLLAEERAAQRELEDSRDSFDAAREEYRHFEARSPEALRAFREPRHPQGAPAAASVPAPLPRPYAKPADPAARRGTIRRISLGVSLLILALILLPGVGASPAPQARAAGSPQDRPGDFRAWLRERGELPADDPEPKRPGRERGGA